MNWYHLLLDAGAVIFCGVLLRYCYHRMNFFIQVYQQNGYKNNEYRNWLKNNWDEKVIPPHLSIYNILIFILLYFNNWVLKHITYSALVIIFFVLAYFWFGSIKRYKPEKVKKPLVFTPRVWRLTVPLILLSSIFPVFFTYAAVNGTMPFSDRPLPNYYVGLQRFDLIMLVFGWAFGALVIPFYVLVAGWITKPVEKFIQKGFIKQAKQKLASMPGLIVIAITGSYGKTSTKFMIRDLLKERFHVCATPGSFNTPMGICKVINNDLQPNHQILILEMGARYEGNIQELCDIAKPDIAVVTNVGLAHLETFGSQDVIAQEKGTLVDNLKANGVAILNADDPYVAEMGKGRNDISRILAGLRKGDIKCKNISYNTSGMAFEVSMGEQVEKFSTRLLGAHNAQNLLLAAAVGHHLGIRLKTMALAASTLQPVEHRLEMKKQGEITIIDDAFNSNPVGAKNAVEILSRFKSGKRIIITPGMVELGEIEEQENFKLGQTIGKANLDLIILVGKERAKPIMKGITSVEEDTFKVQIVDSLFEANDIIKKEAAPGDVILYENDLPDVYNE